MLAKVEAARKRGDGVVVVVSAMGRKGAPYATDTLLGLLDEAGGGDGMTRDLMASCGETISACLVATLLSERGTKAVPLSAYTAGIQAAGPYANADINTVDAKRILAVLDTGSVPVITGFQAVSEDHSVITIGRGGSDTSAVAVGAWLKADFVDIYTDVPGAAGTMRGRFGVCIRVRSTFDDGAGTLVSADPLPADAPRVLGIALTKTGAEATVTVVCREGTSASIVPAAIKTALTAKARQTACADPDSVAFSCLTDDAPALVNALYSAIAAMPTA